MPRKDLVTAPTSEPVSLNQAKDYCRIECDDDDKLIKRLIESARKFCEYSTHRKYGTQTWEQTFQRSELTTVLELESFNVDAVNSVKGYDSDDAETTFVSGTDYSAYNARVVLSLPSFVFREYDSLVVNYDVGGTAVSQNIKDAILMMVLHWYENREAVQVGVMNDILHGSVCSLLAGEMIYTV